MVGLRTGPVPTSLMGAEGYGTKTPFGPHCGIGVTGGSGGSQRDTRGRVACVTEGKREGALATCLFLASSCFGGVDSLFFAGRFSESAFCFLYLARSRSKVH